MKVLIVNSGSTSVKYSLFDDGKLQEARIFDRKKAGMLLNEREYIRALAPDYLAFRVVHAKDKTQTRFLDERTFLQIKEASIYAPIHNKTALEIMGFTLEEFGPDRNICIFDSDFHKDIPKRAYLYALPHEYTNKYHMRKYGFHGLAFESALLELKQEIGYVPENIVAVHAGGGVSVCAIKNGKSVDTSMGATPTDGVMMLTRSGSVDPDLLTVLEKRENLLPSELSRILNFESGFYGMTGSKDTKEIIDKAKAGEEPFASAYELFLYQIKKLVFAYFGVLGAVDVLLLSGGLAFKNEYFADDLHRELKSIPLRKDQVIKVDIDENKLMLKKTAELLNAAKTQ